MAKDEQEHHRLDVKKRRVENVAFLRWIVPAHASISTSHLP
jgi:hypothetical protein